MRKPERIYEFRIWDKLLKKMCNYHPWINVDSTMIMMQFTGFVDKVGKKIFDGDIVQMMNTRGHYVIDFNHHTCSYTASGFPLNTWIGRFLDTRDLHVRGNIYENPELLHVKH